jgi:hypothetical protein
LSGSRGRRDVIAAGVLAILTFLFYFPLTVQGKVLSSFDSLVYFYPNAVYYAERVRQGVVPLWDPYLFAGAPFLANSQAGVLYPLNLLYLLGPVSRIYAVLLVFHVWWLAIGIYLLGRFSLSLARPAALTAGMTVAFGGFVGGMAGHLNQLEALAWAPLAILCVERGAARGAWRLQVAAAIPFAMAVLAGHSQELYMTGVVAALAGFSRAVQRRLNGASAGWCRLSLRRLLTALLWDVSSLVIGPALAVLITAAQVLPTIELTRVSIRSTGLDFATASSFSFPPTMVLTGLLPTIGLSVPSTEWLGYVGITAMVLAVIGLWRRPAAEAWWLAGLALIGLLFALGRYTPVYGLAFDLVPGVRLFRVPARWLTLWTLGMGLLAGWGWQSLEHVPAPGGGLGRRWGVILRRGRPAIVAAGGLLLLVLFGTAYHYRHLIARPGRPSYLLWAATLVVIIAVLVLDRRGRQWARLLLPLVLGLELGIASLSLPYQTAIWIDGVETHRAPVDHLLARASSDRIFAMADNSFDPGDLAQLRQRLAGSLSPAAIAEYVTAVKHIESLTPNMALRFGLRTVDGYDGGVLPLLRFDELKKLFPVQGPTVADGRLLLQLRSAPNPRLLGWLNVRYLLMDRLRDQWIDGVYYDLGVTQELSADQAIHLDADPSFPVSRVGIVLRGLAGPPPPGALTLALGDGEASLVLGPGGPPGRRMSSDLDAGGLWLWWLDLPRPVHVHGVSVRWHGSGVVVLRSLSLIDRESGQSQPVVVSPDYRLDYLGDVKIYEDRDVLPRAFLATGLEVAPNAGQVIARLRSPSWQAGRSAVASAQEVAPSLAFQSGGTPGTARITIDEPEWVEVEASVPARQVLVLTDSYYPGWRAFVDGTEAPILPVDVLFRGVVLEPGSHRVVFRYQPDSWRIGLLLGVIGCIGTVGLLAIRRR